MCGSIRSTRWISAGILVWLAVPVGVAQRHERKRAERAEIVSMEAAWREAQLAENIPEMDHLLADEFLGITAGGQVVTKAQQLDRMRSRQIELRRIDVSDTKIKISGKLAVVTSLARLEGTSEGQALSGSFRYTRVYQHVPGQGWQITNFEATRVPGGTGLYGLTPSAPGIPSAGPPRPHAGAPSSLQASPVVLESPRPRS